MVTVGLSILALLSVKLTLLTARSIPLPIFSRGFGVLGFWGFGHE